MLSAPRGGTAAGALLPKVHQPANFTEQLVAAVLSLLEDARHVSLQPRAVLRRNLLGGDHQHRDGALEESVGQVEDQRGDEQRRQRVEPGPAPGGVEVSFID